MLVASGWQVQSKKQINLTAGIGVAIREYQTDIGPADYATAKFKYIINDPLPLFMKVPAK